MEEEMKVIYPVVISKGSKFLLASVPDCEIDTQGKDLADAIAMARDAISIWCVTEQDMGKPLPKPSALSKVEHSEGDTVTLVDADLDKYRAALDNKAVRKSITIPSRLNTFAEKNHLNFSRVLADAWENMYQQHASLPSAR
jgi:predicted RNase H-like HicB family nuclease